MAELPIPADVLAFVTEVFRHCNQRITEKLSRNPNIPEESLDLTWIEHLSRYSSARVLPSNWTVKIDVHYLGGLRHYFRWEIADVGVLLFIRRGGKIERSKVGLLQSKRLYPTTGTVEEEGKVDYEVGFGRLADPEVLAQSIVVEAEFNFSSECRYGALIAKSEQVKAITDYETTNKVRVYYQFYNPYGLPFVQRVPVSAADGGANEVAVGVRVVPATLVHAFLAKQAKGYRPTFEDLASLVGDKNSGGWPLQHFVAGLFLTCKEGSPFDSVADGRIQNLFYRRSGPIAAAIAIVIEAPEAAG
ncbi:MAG: hypothetical protein ACREOC_14535 [Gemmatimonadales bacterium]